MPLVEGKRANLTIKWGVGVAGDVRVGVDRAVKRAGLAHLSPARLSPRNKRVKRAAGQILLAQPV